MQEQGIQIRVTDLIYALKKRWKQIIACTVIGLLLGMIVTGANVMQELNYNYQIRASFAISPQSAQGTYAGNAIIPSHNDYHLAEDMVGASIYVIKSDHTMNQLIESVGLVGISPAQLRSNLSVAQYNSTQIVEVSLWWPDQEEGIAILNKLIEITGPELQQILKVGSVATINEPYVSSAAGNNFDANMILLCAALGFIAAFGLAVMEILLRPKITNAMDIQSVLNLEVLGAIPEDPLYFNNDILSESNTYHPIYQSFSGIAHILRNRLGTKTKNKFFYVTSTTYEEGKSSVAANIALQLSNMENKVLLIDLNTRNPSVGAMFLKDLDYSRSLNALYAGDINVHEAISHVTPYLDVLPMILGHNALPLDGTIFDLIRDIAKDYQFVIIDAAPVGEISDVLNISQVADKALFVVKQDFALVPSIKQALDKMEKSGVRILGCVANGTGTKNPLDLNTDNKEKERKFHFRPLKRKSAKKKDADPKIWKKPVKKTELSDTGLEFISIDDDIPEQGTKGKKKQIKKAALPMPDIYNTIDTMDEEPYDPYQTIDVI